MLSIRKILQALYYLQSKAPPNPAKYDIMYLLKMIFFADRYHLRHFGFVASGDTYEAMRYGPVASAVKDILYGKMPPRANSAELPALNDVVSTGDTSVLISVQKDDELSKSFKQSLDFALKTYGKYDQLALSAITHDYPEWKKHEAAINKGQKSIEMDFKDFFDNPKTLRCSAKQGIKEDPFEDEEEFLQALREDFNGKNIR
jgi:uncharacterized phage-associated protein